MDFVTIDVVTANADMSSICQIGIATYSNNLLVDQWVSLVDPEDYFDYINVDIHGIDEDAVLGAHKFPELVNKITELLKNEIVVSHTHFDRVSIGRTFAKYNLDQIDTYWLDSAMVARRA